MTSKTFKNRVSVLDAESVLEIADTPAGIRITVSEEDFIVSGWFNPKQGAEIALAILETAGVEPDREPLECQVSLGTIVADLQGAIEYAEALASANREQAELEAEALGLLNAYLHSADTRLYATWEEVVEVSKRMAEDWLAVARKAREIGAEK